MPKVYNGIGTWHHGRANRIVRRDYCEFCGKPGDLQSYDTRHFFVVGFVPLLPLGARRVIDHCPKCQGFRSLPLGQWKREKANATNAALAAFQASPDDAEAALNICRTLIQFQERTIFAQIAPALESRFQHNASVLDMAAAGHASFNRHDLAVQSAARAVALEPANTKLRNALAIYQMRAGSPDEAAVTLAQLSPANATVRSGLAGSESAEAPASDPGMHLLLAEAFQHQGENERALEQFATAFAISPELEQDESLRSARNFSVKNRDQLRRRNSAFFESVRSSDDRAGGWRYWWPNTVAMAVWLVLIGVAATVFTAPMRPRPLHLVNGLPVSYTVTISDQSKELAPYSRTSITLAPEDHEVTVTGEGLEIPPSSLALGDVGLFQDRVEIINPDGVALFIDQLAHYHTDISKAPPDTFKILQPSTYHSLQGFTHAFKDLPTTVNIRSRSGSSATRRHLALVDRGPWDNIILLVELEGIERAAEYARALIDRIGNNNDQRLAYIATSTGEPDVIRTWVQPHLVKRDPLDIELHRAWQDYARYHFPDHDLRTEYRSLVDAEPENSGLFYLCGRAIGGENEQLWFERAAAMDPPSVDALNGLAYNALQLGDYSAALQNAQRATALPGANQRHHSVLHICLAATGNWSDLADQLELNSEGALDNPQGLERRIIALDLAGRADEADQLAAAIFAELDRQDGSTTEAWKKRYAAVRAYLKGDMVTFAADPETTGLEFAAAVTQGDLAAATNALDAYEDESWQSHLLVSLLAARLGDDTARTAHLAKAREDASAPPALLQILDPHAACDPSTLDWSHALPDDIRIAAAVRARLRPDEAATWKLVLMKTNFDPFFPHRFLAEE